MRPLWKEGRVGIGTKTPQTELHVLSGNKTGQNGALKITTSTRKHGD